MPEGIGYPRGQVPATTAPTSTTPAAPTPPQPILDPTQPAFDPRAVAATLFTDLLDHVDAGGQVPGLTSEGAGTGFDISDLMTKYEIQFPDGTVEEIDEATHLPGGENDDHDHGPATTTGSLAWGGHANGRIPQPALMAIDVGGTTHRFEPTAGQAFQSMVAAAAADGVAITLTDSYRTYDQQVHLRQTKGDQVATATPGTSIHGWGRAIDVAGDRARAWIQANGHRYGWIWPAWAQRRGTKSYEPWHFEYRGVPGSGTQRPASSGGGSRTVM